jgi:hypothetical protein
MTTEPAYLVPLEIAERYRVPLATVRHWRHKRYGPIGVRVGNHVIYPAAEVERFDAELARAANRAAARA